MTICIVIISAGVALLMMPLLRYIVVGWRAKRKDIMDGLNADARLAALRAALFVVVFAAALALFFTRRLPTKPPGAPAMIPDGKETPALQDQPE